MPNAVQQAQRLGQSIWMDYISRDMLVSGELERLINLGVVGVTSNPSIFEKAIATGVDYDVDLAAVAKRGRGPTDGNAGERCFAEHNANTAWVSDHSALA